MTIPETLGQMLLFGWDVSGNEYKVNDHAISLIDDMGAGGIVLEERNITAPRSLRVILEELQVRARSCGLPHLFVAVDQEGGALSRLRPPYFPETRTAAEIGVAADPRQARAEARTVGLELKKHGFNLNLAPVLDVLSGADNTVIGDRSYGSDPTNVAAMGVAATRGFQEDAGIMACGKHFPGHGAGDDTLLHGLHIQPHSEKQLREIDLVPFRAAITAGIEAIMVSHLMVPAVDDQLPATMSYHFMTGVLRHELGFEGLIVVDCMEAANGFTLAGMEDKVAGAVLAGADIIFCCHEQDTQIDVHNALFTAVESGHIPLSRIDESLARIARAKERWVA